MIFIFTLLLINGCSDKKKEYSEFSSKSECKNVIYLNDKMKRLVTIICDDLEEENVKNEYRQSLLCMRDRLGNIRYPVYRRIFLQCAKNYPSEDTNDFVNYLFENVLTDIDD